MRAMDIIVIGILAIHVSAIAFARGAWTGVLIIRTPTAVKAALNAAVNVVSWSREQELDAVSSVREGHQQVSCLLGHHSPVG